MVLVWPLMRRAQESANDAEPRYLGWGTMRM